METISSRIKDALRIREMKQTDLVSKTGIGKSSISTYISGSYEPKQRNIYKIAKALNVSETWLMGFDVPMERSYASPVTTTLSFDVSKLEKQIILEFRKSDEITQAMVMRALSIDKEISSVKGDVEKMA